MTSRIIAAALIGLTCVAGCDTVVLVDQNQDYIDAFNDHTDQIDRVADMDAATSFEVPTTGSLTYFGTAGLGMDTNAFTSSVADTSLIGDVRMTANFGTDDMAGRIDNFIGIVDGQPVDTYDGFLTVSNGDLRVLSASQFGASIDGVITGNGDVIGVDGSIIGNLRSEPFRDVSGLSAVTAGGTDFTLNGAAAPGIVSIVAER